MKKILACLFISLLFTCGNPSVVETEQTEIPKIDTSAIKKQEDFLPVLKGINISNINQFIHPEAGLRIIQSEGAMPRLMKTSQVDKNFPVDFSNCIEDSIPKIDCGSKSLWTKEGCFVWKVNGLAAAQVTLWKYCNLSKEEQLEVDTWAPEVSYTAINTVLHARYYFSHINGKWYLLFVDLRRPCSA